MNAAEETIDASFRRVSRGQDILNDTYNKLEERNILDLDRYIDWKSQIRKHIT